MASDANWLVVILMEEMGLCASHFMCIVISEHDWRDFVLRKVGFHMTLSVPFVSKWSVCRRHNFRRCSLNLLCYLNH